MKANFLRHVLMLAASILTMLLCGTICACRPGQDPADTDTGNPSTVSEPVSTATDTGSVTEPVTGTATEIATEPATEVETHTPYTGANSKTPLPDSPTASPDTIPTPSGTPTSSRTATRT